MVGLMCVRVFEGVEVESELEEEEVWGVDEREERGEVGGFGDVAALEEEEEKARTPRAEDVDEGRR